MTMLNEDLDKQLTTEEDVDYLLQLTTMSSNSNLDVPLLQMLYESKKKSDSIVRYAYTTKDSSTNFELIKSTKGPGNLNSPVAYQKILELKKHGINISANVINDEFSYDMNKVKLFLNLVERELFTGSASIDSHQIDGIDSLIDKENIIDVSSAIGKEYFNCSLHDLINYFLVQKSTGLAKRVIFLPSFLKGSPGLINSISEANDDFKAKVEFSDNLVNPDNPFLSSIYILREANNLQLFEHETLNIDSANYLNWQFGLALYDTNSIVKLTNIPLLGELV